MHPSLCKTNLLTSVRTFAIPTETPLDFDLFLIVNQRPTVFRSKGDILKTERVHKLRAQGVYDFQIRLEDWSALKKHLYGTIVSGGALATGALKETGYLLASEALESSRLEAHIPEMKNYVRWLKHWIETQPKWLSNVWSKNPHPAYAINHAVEVCYLATFLAIRANLTESQILDVGLAALLHDIGERTVDWTEVSKDPQKLKESIGQHPNTAARILREIEISPAVIETISQHHERSDGKGYPLGLCENQIRIEAHILSIVDVFSALHHDRPYRRAYSAADSLTFMRSLQPGRFQNDLFRLFLREVIA